MKLVLVKDDEGKLFIYNTETNKVISKGYDPENTSIEFLTVAGDVKLAVVDEVHENIGATSLISSEGDFVGTIVLDAIKAIEVLHKNNVTPEDLEAGMYDGVDVDFAGYKISFNLDNFVIWVATDYCSFTKDQKDVQNHKVSKNDKHRFLVLDYDGNKLYDGKYSKYEEALNMYYEFFENDTDMGMN